MSINYNSHRSSGLKPENLKITPNQFKGPSRKMYKSTNGDWRARRARLVAPWAQTSTGLQQQPAKSTKDQIILEYNAARIHKFAKRNFHKSPTRVENEVRAPINRWISQCMRTQPWSSSHDGMQGIWWTATRPRCKQSLKDRATYVITLAYGVDVQQLYHYQWWSAPGRNLLYKRREVYKNRQNNHPCTFWACWKSKE